MGPCGEGSERFRGCERASAVGRHFIARYADRLSRLVGSSKRLLLNRVFW